MKFANDKNLEAIINNALKEFEQQTDIDLKNANLRSLNEVEPISSGQMDIQALKLIHITQDSLSPLYIIDGIKLDSDNGESKVNLSIYRSSYQDFHDSYLKNFPNAMGVTIIKEFLRVNNEYCNIMAENFKYKSKSEIKIIPIVFLSERPPIVSAGDITKDLRVFLTNPNVLPTQMVYSKKDRDDIGTVLVKTALTIIRASFGIKGMNVKRDVKSAVKKALQNVFDIKNLDD